MKSKRRLPSRPEPPPQQARRSASADTTKTKFPDKMFAALQYTDGDPNLSSIASWHADDKFIILDTDDFMQHVAPRFFPNNASFRSLERLLNQWQFQRENQAERDLFQGDSRKALAKRRIYSHPLFRKSQPELYQTMTRRRQGFTAGDVAAAVSAAQREATAAAFASTGSTTTTMTTTTTAAAANLPVPVNNRGAMATTTAAVAGGGSDGLGRSSTFAAVASIPTSLSNANGPRQAQGKITVSSKITSAISSTYDTAPVPNNAAAARWHPRSYNSTASEDDMATFSSHNRQRPTGSHVGGRQSFQYSNFGHDSGQVNQLRSLMQRQQDEEDDIKEMKKQPARTAVDSRQFDDVEDDEQEQQKQNATSQQEDGGKAEDGDNGDEYDDGEEENDLVI